MFDLSIIGARRLERKLNKLERKVGSKIMRDATKESLEPVEALAKQRVPVDRGLLKRWIKTATFSAQRGRVIGAQVRTGTRKQMRIPAGNEYYYPAAIEYGTKTRAPRSFLRSALADRRDQALKILSGAIKRMLEAV